jgi:16S rRNA (guanine527-N7)-methyltransferase
VSVRPFESTLREGLAELGLSLSDKQVTQLLDYQDLLVKWTRVYNLTAVRDPQDMLTHHLLDSLAVVRPLRHQLAQRHPQGSAQVLDVGSGAGLPGVVIAICCPDLRVTCVDAVAKKVAFIRQAQVALGLAHLVARHARVEALSEVFDVVCSRAFASLVDFVDGSRQLLADGACWMAMKGQQPSDEIAALPTDVRVFHVEQLQVPGLDAQRCIVWMAPAAAG